MAKSPPRYRGIDKYPEPDGSKGERKRSQRTSVTTTLRRREPTAPWAAEHHPSMVWDYGQQMPLVPDSDPNVSVEATQKTGDKPYRTMNRDGKPYALRGVMVGGAPDARGVVGGKIGSRLGLKK